MLPFLCAGKSDLEDWSSLSVAAGELSKGAIRCRRGLAAGGQGNLTERNVILAIEQEAT